MNRQKCEPIDGLDHLSYSRMQAYLSCGLAFRFRYVDRLRPAFTPSALAFGAAFHEAIEEALAGMMVGTKPAVEELIAVVANSLDEQHAETAIQYSDDGGKDALLELASRMLAAWINWPRPSGRILAVEQSFVVTLSPELPPLHGRIDVVEEFDDHVLLTDVKTSRSAWSTQQLDEHAPQLVLYREATRELSRQLAKPVRLAYEVVTKTKAPKVERYVIQEPTEAIARQIRIAQLVVRAVTEGIFVPQLSWACSTCPYAAACRDWGR